MTKKFTVLIVDDSESMRKVIIMTLEHAGFKVFDASDGEQALAMARSQDFDAVLTDINMPKMNGLTLIKELRTLSNYRHTPLITITTESSQASKKQGKDAGATGWIVKPIKQDKLLSVMDQFLY